MAKFNFCSKFISGTLFLVSSFLILPASASPNRDWVATWGTNSTETGHSLGETQLNQGDITPKTFDNKTIRMIVHPTLKGKVVRIRLKNAYPTGLQSSSPPFIPLGVPSNTTVTIDKAHVALRDSGASVVGVSDRVLTFNGLTTVTIPANGEVISDPVNLKIKNQSDLAISLHVVPTGMTSEIYAPRHLRAQQTSYFAEEDGDFTSNIDGAPFINSTTQWFYVSGVDVLSKKPTIVAFGSSITEGYSFDNSTLDKNVRYTDFLAKKLRKHGNPMGVVNAGIFGNQVLFNSPSLPIPIAPGVIVNTLVFPSGPSGLSRFNDDVLNTPGVGYVIFNPTLNDVMIAFQLPPGLHPIPTVDELLNGYRQIIAQAHAQGVKIIGATITPRWKANSAPEDTGEITRQAVNNWILTSCEFDGVIDFASAVADHNDPRILAIKYDSGDGIHPNQAGYKAMANSINLNLFDR